MRHRVGKRYRVVKPASREILYGVFIGAGIYAALTAVLAVVFFLV